MAFCSKTGCQPNVPLWQVLPTNLQPRLTDWLACKANLCHIVVHQFETLDSNHFDKLSNVWDASDKFPKPSDHVSEDLPLSEFIPTELNAALQSFCSSCCHTHHSSQQHITGSEELLINNEFSDKDLSGLAVNIITSFSDDFVRNLISDALQEAAYVMTETRCRRMRLERQRQQNLTRTLEQSSQINVGRAMQHSNSFISNVKRFNSIGSNTLPFQRNSISRINRSLPDVRRDSARRSSLHSLPTTIIHGKGNLRRNSSSNVQRRRVERLHRCDARQFSEADEDSQCSAPDVDKLCLVVLQENGNGDSDNNSNNKVSDGCILDQSHNSSLVANGFASAASDIQLSPAKEVAACSNNHLGIVPNKNVDGQQYKILQSRLLTKPNAHLLNNLCLTTKSNAACHSSLLTSSCYHGNVSAVQNACNEARETDSICNLKSTDVCQINGSLSDSLCLNLHSDLATVKLSNLCQKRIDQMASNILNDAVENAVLVMRKGFETVACSLPNKDNCIPHELLIYSRTSDIVNYINSTALEIMNNAIAEAVDTICHCNFLQHNNALVETDVTESVQQLADDFVCHVMQDAVNKVTNDQMSARLHAQMSLEEIRDDWVRPLNNMQRSLAFFDVEFGGGNFIAALSPRASMSSSILEMNRRHNSVDEWQRGHRRSSSSSGSSGSSRRSTVLLDFEDELRRSGSIVEHCRAGHDLDEFRRYLSERAGEYSESKPKLTVRSNSSAQQSDSFTPLIMQSSTSSKSDNSHLSGAENNSAHKIEKQVTSYAKSKLHWFSWDLVIEAFRSALPLITSRTEQSSCIVSRCDSLPDHVMQQNKYIVKEEKSASESVVPKIFENFNEKPLPSENKLLASAQTIANQLCSNIFMDAIQNVSCHASQDCLSNSEQCENVSEMLNPFAEDIANQIINDAMHWATAATKKCLFVQRRPIVMYERSQFPHRIGKQLHALLMWAAASYAGCSEFHYIFPCRDEHAQLKEVCDKLKVSQKSVGRLVQYLYHYCQSQSQPDISLFSFILHNSVSSEFYGSL